MLKIIILSLLLLYTRAEVSVNLKCQNDSMTTDLPFCIPNDYKKDVLPFTNTPTNVTVLFKLKDIIKVDDEQATVRFIAYLMITWIEPRIKLVRSSSAWMLGRDFKWAYLNPASFDYLWLPDIDIINLKSFRIRTVGKEHGDLSLSDGKRIWYYIPAEITLECPLFEFTKYPFDKQVCKFLIGSFGYNAKENLYRGNLVDKRKPQEALQYEVDEVAALTFEEGMIDYNLYYYTVDGKMKTYNDTYSYFGIKMTFTRLLLPHLICTFLPSFLLVLSSWIGFVIPMESVPGRIALSVTSLLVLMNMRYDFDIF